MRFTLSFDMDNDAFAEDRDAEAADILHRVAQRVSASAYYLGHSVTILDSNGNDVGRWKVTDES